MRSKVIFKAIGSFGGSAYRAIDRGDQIAIQESTRGARWKDLAACSASEFYDRADSVDLFNPYNSNPAHLFKIAQAIVINSNN
jgi:hypothetical protein